MIDEEYRKMVEWYEKSRKQSSATGCEAVLHFLLDHPETTWFWSWQFVGQTTKNGLFLSHRAPARASDLAKYEPELVEDKRIGRFCIYRLRWENLSQVKKRLNILDEVAQPKTWEWAMVETDGIRKMRRVPV